MPWVTGSAGVRCFPRKACYLKEPQGVELRPRHSYLLSFGKADRQRAVRQRVLVGALVPVSPHAVVPANFLTGATGPRRLLLPRPSVRRNLRFVPSTKRFSAPTTFPAISIFPMPSELVAVAMPTSFNGSRANNHSHGDHSLDGGGLAERNARVASPTVVGVADGRARRAGHLPHAGSGGHRRAWQWAAVASP